MNHGAFTAGQRAVFRGIAKRKAKKGELKRLAREWDRPVGSVRYALSYARAGGYDNKKPPRDSTLSTYTKLMRRIWAEWECAHVSRAPTPQA